jgi:hypothetical protein
MKTPTVWKLAMFGIGAFASYAWGQGRAHEPLIPLTGPMKTRFRDAMTSTDLALLRASLYELREAGYTVEAQTAALRIVDLEMGHPLPVSLHPTY